MMIMMIEVDDGAVGGVHHHDENGLRESGAEPAHIQRIHRDEIEFVTGWLDEKRRGAERGKPAPDRDCLYM